MTERLRVHAVEYWEAARRFSSAARRFLVVLATLGIAYGVFSTLFPLYVVALGYDERFLGSLVAVGTLTGAVAALPAGVAFDRYGGRTVLLVGLSVAGIGIAIECFATEAWLLLVGSALAALGVTLAMVAQAPLLAAVSTERERTYLYGVAAALGVLASVFGTLYAGMAPAWIAHRVNDDVLRYRITLVSGCAPALLAAWLVWKMVVPRPVGSERVLELLSTCLSNSAVRRLLWTGMLLASGGGLVLPLLNVFLSQQFAVGSREVALVRTAGTVATVAGALAAPVLAARLGLLLGVVVGRAVSAPWLLATALAPNWWLAGAAYAARTFWVYCSDPLHTDFSMRVVPPGLRATTNSLTFLAWNRALAVTGWLGGQIAWRFGYTTLFSLGALLTLIAAACFALAFRAAKVPRRSDG